MTAKLIAGGPIAESIKAEAAAAVAKLSASGITPCLAVVRVGEDEASAVYVGAKVRTAAELGIRGEHIHLSAETSQTELMDIVRSLNERDDVDGILVQLPLPGHINEAETIRSISPAKDVDGLHPLNAGMLLQGQVSLRPCTPAGIIEMLKRSAIPISGRHAVIVGRSNIVGKPVALLLLAEDSTVTICHSRTADLAGITRQADILVAAVGRPGFITREHIRHGAVVIDVGINKLTDESRVRQLFPAEDVPKRLAAIEKRGYTLIGDVDQQAAMERAAYFTPVPGGVGLLTVAMLMKNTIAAAAKRRGSQL